MSRLLVRFVDRGSADEAIRVLTLMLLPALIFAAVRVGSPAPQAASAQPGAAGDAVSLALGGDARGSLEQLRALAGSLGHRGPNEITRSVLVQGRGGFRPLPFSQKDEVLALERDGTEPRGDDLERSLTHAATLRLTAVVQGRRPVAVINREVRRVGEQMGHGWRLEGIDADGRSAVLTHQSGARHVLRLD